MSHYARSTAPGWVRVSATSSNAGVLATAWISPDGDALTVILVNPEPADAVVNLALGDGAPVGSHVTRTVFSGVERSMVLGALPAAGIVGLPGESVATVTVEW